MPELVSHYGEPFGDSSAIPTYYVSKMASNHVKMVLSGDGGDELFCGYRRYDYWKTLCENSIKLNFQEIKKLCSQILHGERLLKKDSLESYLKMVQYLGSDLRSKLWKSEYENFICKSISDFETEYSKTKKLGYLHKAQYFDMKTYMPYDCLTKVDIASMCHSIEVRTPFVDKEVLKFALRLPIGETYCRTSEYGFQGKFLLKEMLAKDLGKDFVYRTKRGFSIPLQNWLQDENNLACKMKNNLLSDSTMISNFFKKDVIKRIVESNNQYHIYVLIFLEEWLHQNI